MNSDLLIVTLPDSVQLPELPDLAEAERGMPAALELLETGILRQAKERAVSIGAPRVRTWSGSGDVAQTIIETAKREKADIIIVGRRGRGQLADLLLGSVSQKLVSLAPAPVLVVP